jgi:hypothetical protein
MQQQVNLKGDVNKKFKAEARRCYSFFYDEDGHFRDEELQSKNGNGFELPIRKDGQEIIIKGQNRKELMKQYFDKVFLPEIQKNVINNADEIKSNTEEIFEPGDIQTFDLMDKIKLGEN